MVMKGKQPQNRREQCVLRTALIWRYPKRTLHFGDGIFCLLVTLLGSCLESEQSLPRNQAIRLIDTEQSQAPAISYSQPMTRVSDTQIRTFSPQQ